MPTTQERLTVYGQRVRAIRDRLAGIVTEAEQAQARGDRARCLFLVGYAHGAMAFAEVNIMDVDWVRLNAVAAWADEPTKES